jgi:hypothetical protein
MGRPASTAFGLATGNVEGWEDIVCLIAIAGQKQRARICDRTSPGDARREARVKGERRGGFMRD